MNYSFFLMIIWNYLILFVLLPFLSLFYAKKYLNFLCKEDNWVKMQNRFVKQYYIISIY